MESCVLSSLLVTASILMPIGWMLVMGIVQLLHWLWAWVTDTKTQTNIMMSWTMLHIFKYRVNDNNNSRWDGLFIDVTNDGDIIHESDGALAIFMVPIILAMLPVSGYLIYTFYLPIIILVVSIATMYGIRSVVRLSKAVKNHATNTHLHVKRDL